MKNFTSKMVSEHLTRIVTPFGVCMYLVRGTKSAALLDTGFGVGDLKGYIDAMVHTPYVVLISHGHLDHAGGASQFEQVYLNEKDWELEQWHCTLDRRKRDVCHSPVGVPDGIKDEDFLPSRTAPYLPLDEGNRFELGGVSVCPVAVPGHTDGMMSFLIPEDRTLIMGDACGEHTLIHRENLEEYQAGLKYLREFENRFDTALRNHGLFCAPKQILADNLELCGEILAGTDAAYPWEFHGVQGCLGRPEEHPGKVGNIFYAVDAWKEF